MSQVAKYSTNGKNATEVQVLFKFPVLDCDCSPKATQGSVLDSTARISVHVEVSVKEQFKTRSANMKGESLFKPMGVS